MRGKQAPKRKIDPDYKFNRVDIAKFINYLMQDGKKTVAEKIFYGSMDIVSQKTKKDALEVFDAALRNVSPIVEVKGRRIGGANYQVPVEVRGERQFTLASRWIIGAANNIKGKSMKNKLATVIMDSATGQGDAVKKREDVHKMAEANRAFAHFA